MNNTDEMEEDIKRIATNVANRFFKDAVVKVEVVNDFTELQKLDTMGVYERIYNLLLFELQDLLKAKATALEKQREEIIEEAFDAGFESAIHYEERTAAKMFGKAFNESMGIKENIYEDDLQKVKRKYLTPHKDE